MIVWIAHEQRGMTRCHVEPMNEMVPLVGIELTTYRLQGGCSTN